MALKNIIFFFLMLSAFSSHAEIKLHYKLNGLKGTVLENAKQRLDISLKREKYNNSKGEMAALKHQVIENIHKAIEPYGYFKATIATEVVCGKNECRLILNVTKGPRVSLRKVSLKVIGEGIYDKRLDKIRDELTLRAGDYFDTVKYKKEKEYLYLAMRRLGYLKASVMDSRLIVNLKKYYADVNFIIKSGPAFRFGEVRFKSTSMSSHFLKRYVPFLYLDYFSNEKVQQLEDALMGSNFFDSVKITPEIEKAKNSVVPIYVSYALKKSIQYDFGLGIGTDTGVRGLLGMELRHIRNGGQYLKMQVQLSKIATDISARYIIPGKNPATEQYSISASSAYKEQENGESSSQSIRVDFSKKYSNWRKNIGVSFINEKSNLGNDPSKKNMMLVPYMDWALHKVDEIKNPNNGYTLSLTLKGSLNNVLSNVEFLQIIAGGKYQIDWEKYGSRFLFKTQLGVTFIDDIRNLPFSLQVFSGGAKSVRGYEYNSIGPGKYLSLASIEFQKKIIENWYAISFIDSGSVSNQKFRNFKSGVGAGILWQSPIGSIVITTARAISSQGKPWLIQFSMGSGLL